MVMLQRYNVPHLRGMLSHFTSIFFELNKTNIYSVIMRQNDIFVLDKCEINADEKLYSEPHVDLHKLRTSKC